MDAITKRKIKQNWDELMKNTDLRNILPVLKRKRIIKQYEIKQIESAEECDKNKCFYLMVLKGTIGSRDEIIKIFEESSHGHLAILLSGQNSNTHAGDLVLEGRGFGDWNHEQPISGTSSEDTIEKPLEIVVKKATEFKDLPDSGPARYPMRSRNRGTYLIINNIEFDDNKQERRCGAKADHENLLNLFNQLKFKGEDYKNLTRDEMMTTINNFTQSNLLNKTDCCVVVIMSHGDEENNKPFVYTRDNYKFDLAWLKDAFSNYKCTKLQRIPKIFILQCCRGKQPDKAVGCSSGRVSHPGGNLTADSVVESELQLQMPTYSDMLICWSTVSGFSSFRYTTTGTWYIEAICDVWAKYAHTYHVEELMKLVQEQIASRGTIDGVVQTTTVETIAFNTCYLNPRLYKNPVV